MQWREKPNVSTDKNHLIKHRILPIFSMSEAVNQPLHISIVRMLDEACILGIKNQQQSTTRLTKAILSKKFTEHS